MNVYLIRYRCVLHALQSSSMCQRGCCWTPFGHSGVAEGCRCHGFDEFTLYALIRAQQLHDVTFSKSKYLTAEDVA